MASEYDALLAEPAKQSSEYDALLAPEPNPSVAGANKVLADTQNFPEGSPQYQAATKIATGQDLPQTTPEPSTFGQAYTEGGLTGVALMPNKVTAAANALGIPDLPPATNTGGKIVRTALQFPEKVGDFLTSPEGAALAAGGAASGPVALAELLGFGGQQADALIHSKTPEEITSNALGLATLGLGAHELARAKTGASLGEILGIKKPEAEPMVEPASRMTPLGEPLPEVPAPPTDVVPLTPTEPPAASELSPAEPIPVKPEPVATETGNEAVGEALPKVLDKLTKELAPDKTTLEKNVEKFTNEQAGKAEGENSVPSESPPAVAENGQPSTEQASTSETTDAAAQSPTGIRNAIVDQQRVDKGLPPRIEPLRKANPEAWDAAMAKVDKNPQAGAELVNDIKDHPRALKPEESALLAHETVTRENAFDTAVDDVNTAKTPEDLLAAKTRLAVARDSVQELYDVGQRVGTESGQSLQARKLMVTKDYSLSRMEAEKRAVSNDGKPLTEKQLAEVKDAHDKIAELQAKVAEFEGKQSQEKQMDVYRAIIKEGLQSARENAKAGRSLQETLDTAAESARKRIIERRGRLQVTVDPLNVAGLVDEAIIGASHIARGVTKFADWSAEMIHDFGDRIKPFLQDLYDKAKQYHDANAKLFSGASKQEINAKRYTTLLENKTAELLNKMEIGDFTKAQRTKTVLNDEQMKVKARYEEVKDQFETQLKKDELANRPNWQKVLEQVAGAARASALSGYHTLAKLATYDLAKFVETPLTETVGAALSKVPGLRGIAEKANLESGSTLQAIGKFYSAAAGKGLREAARVLKSGTSEAKLLYGKKDYQPPKWYDFFGNLHQAEKVPLLTGTQEMYRTRAYANAIKEGLNPNDEFTKAAINKAVYDYSQKSILQENNKFSAAVNGLHARLEAVNPKTGQVDIANATISTLVKTFLTKGIVRTPANYFAQTIARTPIGLGTGLVKAGMANYRGIGNLHPIEANAISALIKTGAVGSAFFVLGAIDATKSPEDRTFGGYWQPGRKRDGEDVDWGKIRIGDKTFPHLVTHNPLTESAQMGSTMMRVALSKLRKKDEDTQGLAQGVVKSVIGLAGKAPIASPAMRLGQDSNAAGDLLNGLIPQLLQNIAEDTDSSERKATTTTEKLKAGIPVLRETLDEK